MAEPIHPPGTPIPDRMTVEMDEDFVVFLIGMRPNRWWKLRKVARVAGAMGKMIQELYAQPELGLIHHESWVGFTTLMVQYWRSEEHLFEYAKARDSAHLPAWREFNRLVGKSGDVGVWHETYRIPRGNFECVYANMPPFGLGRAGRLVEATGHRARARDRIGAAPDRRAA